MNNVFEIGYPPVNKGLFYFGTIALLGLSGLILFGLGVVLYYRYYSRGYDKK